MTVSINKAPIEGHQVSYFKKHDAKGLLIHVTEVLQKICLEYTCDFHTEDLPQLASDLIEDYKHWKLADFPAFGKLAARGKLKKVIEFVSYGVVKGNLSKRHIEEMAKVYDHNREEKVEVLLEKQRHPEKPTEEEMIEFHGKIEKMKVKAAEGKLKPPLDFNERMKRHGMKPMADLKREDEDFKKWRKKNGY